MGSHCDETVRVHIHAPVSLYVVPTSTAAHTKNCSRGGNGLLLDLLEIRQYLAQSRFRTKKMGADLRLRPSPTGRKDTLTRAPRVSRS